MPKIGSHFIKYLKRSGILQNAWIMKLPVTYTLQYMFKSHIHVNNTDLYSMNYYWLFINIPTMYSPGLSIRGGTRYFYPPKMVFGTFWF
jgi:hypothetical protein